MQKTLSTKKGFTLIEIVIALAIAALIIVIVLLGVTGAQRSQRNDGRRALADKSRAAITDARANLGVNGGTPTVAQVAAAVPDKRGPVDSGAGLIAYTYQSSALSCSATSAPTAIRIEFAPDKASVCLEGGATYNSQ